MVFSWLTCARTRGQQAWQTSRALGEVQTMCTRTRTHTHTHARTHSTHAHTHMRTHSTHAQTQACTRTHTHTHGCVRTSAFPPGSGTGCSASLTTWLAFTPCKKSRWMTHSIAPGWKEASPPPPPPPPLLLLSSSPPPWLRSYSPCACEARGARLNFAALACTRLCGEQGLVRAGRLTQGACAQPVGRQAGGWAAGCLQ